MSTENRIQLALADLETKRFTSVRKAAEFYSVPRSTLQDRFNGKPTRQEGHSYRQVLSPLQEEMLAKWCLDLECLAQAPNHAQIREMASLILRTNGLTQTLGKNWVPNFLRRNPRVKTKLGRAIDRKRTQGLERDAINTWFEDLIAIIEHYNITANNYWNMDEIGTALGPCSNQLVVGSSTTNSSIIKMSNEREWCTAIETINPFGQSITPLLIFKAKHVQNQWFIPSQTPDWIYSSSKSAFTTNEIGLKWLEEIFIPQTANSVRTGEWRLLILDGHKSHVTPEFMNLAYLNRIWCYYLLPHASHALQPLDIAVFSPLKRVFRALVAFENQFDDHEPQKKATFLLQYQKARERAIKPTNCASGFQTAGIWPYNPQKVISSPWVIQLPPQSPQTPPRATITPKSQLWDPTKTPRGHQDLHSALYTLSHTRSLPRDVRLVITKSSKALQRVNMKFAASQREVKVHKQAIEKLKAKKKKKEPVNPNKDFIALSDIQVGPTPLERPTQDNCAPETPIIRTQTPEIDSASSVNPFLVITNSLQSIRYN